LAESKSEATMATLDEIRNRMRTLWGGAAGAWDRHSGWYEDRWRPVTEWILEAAGLAPGGRVLDVGCGTGLPALALAEQVGPDGRVVALDLASEMLAVTRRRAREAGYAQLVVEEGDAEALRFADTSFDAVTSSFTLMFCPDPARAVSEMRRVLVPGGRLVVVAWDALEKSPFLSAIVQAAGTVFGTPPPDPQGPGPFRFSPPGVLESVLRSAGFTRVEVRSLPVVLDCGSMDEYWDVVTDMSAGLRPRIEALPAAEQVRLRHLVENAVAPHRVAGRLRLPITPLCARAVR
jgi:SAM-dependent methyltransferase